MLEVVIGKFADIFFSNIAAVVPNQIKRPFDFNLCSDMLKCTTWLRQTRSSLTYAKQYTSPVVWTANVKSTNYVFCRHFFKISCDLLYLLPAFSSRIHHTIIPLLLELKRKTASATYPYIKKNICYQFIHYIVYTL